MPKMFAPIVVETKQFNGWSLAYVPKQQELSSITEAMYLFESEVIKALSEDIDVYQVTLYYNDNVSRQLTFDDRKAARES